MSHCFIFFTTIVPLFAGDLCGSSPSIQKYQDILNGTDNSHFKIIGGRESVNGDWPWLIQLEYGTIVKRHGWAGTIIGAKWVLTATHCEITPESDHVIHYDCVIDHHNPDSFKNIDWDRRLDGESILSPKL